MHRSKGHLFIGETLDANEERTGTPVEIEAADLTTHGVIVGMTGSGKTGLGVVLLEEALMNGIPVLAIDPKGDISNLALTFPDLDAASFEPWIDAGTARVEGTSVAELADATATTWRDGLASWGLSGDDVGELQERARPVIYTPGSDAGVPINALGRLDAPDTDDPSVIQDEVDAVVSAMLGLIDIDSDPLSGREHVLMANLVSRSWDAGTDLDLPTLIGQIMDPPMRKLGVLEVDTFFPPADRQTLALKLNGLLASPGFAAWATGVPLDMGSMLWDEDGKPRAAVCHIAHLSDSERIFATTLILSRLISWMRTQSGTGELRVLVYLDEVMGLAPPVGNPPSKKPILTLLKQARAFGVGLVLATQNPVDLDYKAISNAGTWLIGRLQTEQDKNRLVDGLRAADGSVDVSAIQSQISGLGKRQFIVRQTKNDDLPQLTTRWAMSYLAGPLTGEQIGVLTEDAKAAHVTEDADEETSSGPKGPELADDETSVMPTLPDSIPVRYVHATAPWLEEVGAEAGGLRLTAALAARCSLIFDERKADDLRHSEEWEAIVALGADPVDWGKATAVDFDDRDFTESAPDGARYVLMQRELSASDIRAAKTELKETLYRGEELEIWHNPELKLYGRPGEPRSEFEARCQAAADEGADAETAKIRDRLERKRDQIEAAIAKAEDRVTELEVQSQGRDRQKYVDIGTSLLGGLLGGRKSSRSLSSAARRAYSGQTQSSNSKQRLESARNRVAEKVEDLGQLEADLADALFEIDDEWSAKAGEIDSTQIPLEKSDISVDDLMLVWLPAAD